MGNDWAQVKLGDYIESCLGKMLDKNKNIGEYHPYLGNSNVRWGAFELDDLAEMKFEKHEHSRYGIKQGDLIICEGGEPGRCAIWEGDIPNMKIQKALHRVRPLPGLDNEYLYYWFLFSTRAGHIEPFFTGTTIKHLTGKALKEIPIRIPPLKYQQDGAKLLRGLDKKITLNRHINQTLEQMAQALFKSWFVDFDPVVDNALDAGFFEQDLDLPDELLRRVEARQVVRKCPDFKPLPDATRQLFPAAFEECTESLLGIGGWVPKGWKVAPLENVTSLIIDHRGKTPKKLGGDWSVDGHPAISAKNIKNGRLVQHDAIRYVDSDLYKRWMKDILLAGDVLMTSEAPLGELLYLAKNCDYLLSQRLYGIRADNEIISGCYLYFWLQTNVAKSDMDGRATGTTVVGIRQSELRKINVMTPQRVVVDSFSKVVTHYLEKIESNEKQNTELEKLRDTLLPKLISGELLLDDIGADLTTE